VNASKQSIGNERLHEISNYNGIRAVTFCISKNLTVKIGMFAPSTTYKCHLTSIVKAPNQIEHTSILVDKRRHSFVYISFPYSRDMSSTQFPSTACYEYLVAQRAKPTGQLPILKSPQSVLFPYSETPLMSIYCSFVSLRSKPTACSTAPSGCPVPLQ
jgi:hypothetical protein